MPDPIGTLSFIWQVSKELYLYYQAVSHCDDDITELRAQLLWLQQVSDAVIAALRRDTIPTESKALVNAAVQRCGDAAKDLDSALKQIEHHDPHAQKAAEKLRTLGRRLVYPFKKSTIASLVENTDACREELQTALTLLGVQISAKNGESLRKLDETLVKGLASIESALDDLKLRLPGDQAGAIQQHTTLIHDGADRERAVRLVKTLEDSALLNRRQEIPDEYDITLEWLKSSRDQGSSQVNDLLQFLEAGTGLFWIQGRPAAGKSVLMKFLVEHGPDSAIDPLWKWPEKAKVIVASHFFWIAGGHVQKSRHGLAQSLLHEVLSSDLTLVPRICGRRWKDEGSGRNWSIKELWDTLHAAISESDAHFHFFIDGLDECQPESEHRRLIADVNKLTSSNKVKVITSSRIWDIFQDNLVHDSRCLRMEESNHGAIVTSIRDRMEGLTRGMALADQVAWDCLHRSPDCFHPHPEIHKIVCDIVVRAQGVFLWVSIVMDSICKHIEASRPLQVLRKSLDAFPKRLEQYFRQLVFDRIHDSLTSDTAMALKIALKGGEMLIHFSLLRECTGSGDSVLVDPDFVSKMTYSPLNVQSTKLLMLNTMDFLSVCCRDILCRKGSLIDPRRITIGFTHRTAYDFLLTSQMEAFLNAHVPSHFQDDFLLARLELATWKFVPYEGRLSNPSECWWSLVSTLRSAKEFYIDNYPREHGSWTKGNRRKLLRLAADAQEIALNYFNNWPVSDRPSVEDASARELGMLQALQVLSCELAHYGAYRLTERILESNPEYLCKRVPQSMDLPILHALAIWASADFNVPRRGVDCKLLTLLLQAGADPNMRISTFEPRENRRNLAQPTPASGSGVPSGIEVILAEGRENFTPWQLFLDRLLGNEQSRMNAFLAKLDDLTRMEGGHCAWVGLDAEEDESPGQETFSTPHIQNAIKALIEHGAELRYRRIGFDFIDMGDDPEVILRRWVPGGRAVCDWPSMLGNSALPESPMSSERMRRKRLEVRSGRTMSCNDLQSLLSESSQGL